MTDVGTLDTVVQRFASAFSIPGVAVAVVRPGAEPLILCHGTRTLGDAGLVDADTSFAIASNSKAFLAACLAMLVDDGKIGWDDPVRRHLPEFRMFDEHATALMTIRDLLVHRSGLPLGAADLMQVRPGRFTPSDVLRALQYFKPAAGFRATYAYDNCLYIVAGILLERVSGLDWNAFLARRVFAPLGMNVAVGSPTLVTTDNRAGRHARLGPPVIGLGPVERIVADETDLNGPAGGIQASAAEMTLWIGVQLARGRLPQGERLWSEAQATEMWTPQTIISSGPGPTPDAPQRSVMEGYALGWGVAQFRGQRMLTHGGQVAGQVSRVAILPDAGIGLAILTNSAEGDAVSALRYAILDLLLDQHGFDWLDAARRHAATVAERVEAALTKEAHAPAQPSLSLPLSGYAGRYRDPWYGDVIVEVREGGLHIAFEPTPSFTGALEPIGTELFRTRFARGAGEDAAVQFVVRDGRVTAMTMRALSPLADFSFDFHDLALVPVQG